jgi:hypothetical protein
VTHHHLGRAVNDDSKKLGKHDRVMRAHIKRIFTDEAMPTTTIATAKSIDTSRYSATRRLTKKIEEKSLDSPQIMPHCFDFLSDHDEKQRTST